MISYFGDFAEDDTVNIPFNTFTSDDPAASSTITNLVDADIKVHKDGGLAQAVTDGASVIINFDGITGNHLITIDTSVDAFYVTGSEYQVRIEGTTVDVGTINAWVGCFSIERAGGALAVAKTIKTETVLILADTADIQPNYATSTAVADVPTVAEFNARTLVAASYFDPAADAVATVTAVTNGVTLAADAITSAKIADGAFLAVNFAASSLNGKGDWNIGKTGYALSTADWNVGKTGYSLTTAPLTAAEINTQCDLALSDINLDHFVGTAAGIPALPAGTYLDLLQDDGTATYSRTTDSLQAIRDHATTVKTDTAAILTDTADIQPNYATSTAVADVPTVAEFNARTLVAASYFDPAADAVANVTLTATTTASTDAETAIAALNNVSTADVNTQCDLALSDINLDHFVGTASGIPALPAGTYLDLLQDDGTATYSRTTDSMQAIRDHATTVKTDTASILTDTAEIGTAGAGLSNINLPNQTMDIVGNITGNLSGSIGSNLELGPAEVNTEVDNALNVTTYAEPAQGTPGATVTIQAKIGFLYKAWRNKSLQNATTYELYNDDTTTVDHKATVSDDTTSAIKGEVGTGP